MTSPLLERDRRDDGAHIKGKAVRHGLHEWAAAAALVDAVVRVEDVLGKDERVEGEALEQRRQSEVATEDDEGDQQGLALATLTEGERRDEEDEEGRHSEGVEELGEPGDLGERPGEKCGDRNIGDRGEHQPVHGRDAKGRSIAHRRSAKENGSNPGDQDEPVGGEDARDAHLRPVSGQWAEYDRDAEKVAPAPRDRRRRRARAR